jgi:murein DD-endopeptidase MepM/ murein hydrolase activator NlpD
MSITTTPRARRRWFAVVALCAAAIIGSAQQAQASPVTMGLPATRAEINPAWLSAPHHGYPAIDIPFRQGTTARAIFNGRVTWVGFEAGGCGYGATLAATTADGVRLEATYCHARVMPSLNYGQLVNAFQPVLSVGSTGSSTGPHLHIQVKRNGVKVCPQAALRAAWNSQVYDFNRAPTTGCTY